MAYVTKLMRQRMRDDARPPDPPPQKETVSSFIARNDRHIMNDWQKEIFDGVVNQLAAEGRLIDDRPQSGA